MKQNKQTSERHDSGQCDVDGSPSRRGWGRGGGLEFGDVYTEGGDENIREMTARLPSIGKSIGPAPSAEEGGRG